jgi:hypothetical protein
METDPYLIPAEMIEQADWTKIEDTVLALIGAELGHHPSCGTGATGFLPGDGESASFANYMSGRSFNNFVN